MGLKQDVPSSDAFAVLIKYKNDNRPILLTQVYERDTLYRLVKLNEFKGVLLASEDRSNTDFKDLLLRFIEIDGERKFFSITVGLVILTVNQNMFLMNAFR